MLVNSHNLDCITFASKSPVRPVLTGLLVTPTHTVATDSYCLIEVETPKVDENEIPTQLQTSWPTAESASVIIPDGAIKKAMRNVPKKPMLPIIKNIAIDYEACNDEKRMTKVLLKTTDIDTIDKVETRAIDGSYPDYRQVLPTKKPVAALRLDANQLTSMASFFAKHTKDDNAAIVLELHGSTSPAIFRAETEEMQKMTGLIMPLRSELDDAVMPEHLYAETTARLLARAFEYIPKDTKEGSLYMEAQELLHKINPSQDINPKDLPS